MDEGFAARGTDPRIGLELLYNPDAQRALVFGNSGSLQGEDLWEWNGVAWTQRQIVGTIAPRYREAVAYDAAHHAIVVFSGRVVSSGTPTGGTQLLAYWPNTTPEACTSAQIDYDNDGQAGCADADCWSVCTPLCPPGATCPAGAPALRRRHVQRERGLQHLPERLRRVYRRQVRRLPLRRRRIARELSERLLGRADWRWRPGQRTATLLAADGGGP